MAMIIPASVSSPRTAETPAATTRSMIRKFLNCSSSIWNSDGLGFSFSSLWPYCFSRSRASSLESPAWRSVFNSLTTTARSRLWATTLILILLAHDHADGPACPERSAPWRGLPKDPLEIVGPGGAHHDQISLEPDGGSPYGVIAVSGLDGREDLDPAGPCQLLQLVDYLFSQPPLFTQDPTQQEADAASDGIRRHIQHNQLGLGPLRKEYGVPAGLPSGE